MQKTDFPFEYIIGEDCSTDGTREIVFEYAKKYPDKIRVITAGKNVGMTENIRRLILAARGKYIALCEGDDYWTDPLKLQKQIDVLEKNTNIVITYHDALVIKDGKIVNANGTLCEDRKRNFTGNEIKTGINIITSTMCFRNVIKKFPENYYKVFNADTFLTSLLGNYGGGIYMHTITPNVYNAHSGGIWTNKSKIERELKSLSTPIELMKFYKKKKDLEFYEYFKRKTQIGILSIIEKNLTFPDKKFLYKILIKYCKCLGCKNSFYYLKKLFIRT